MASLLHRAAIIIKNLLKARKWTLEIISIVIKQEILEVTGTVHTSAKARVTSVAIRILIIRIATKIKFFVHWPIANLP